MQGRPAKVDSPWIDLKISVTTMELNGYHQMILTDFLPPGIVKAKTPMARPRPLKQQKSALIGKHENGLLKAHGLAASSA